MQSTIQKGLVAYNITQAQLEQKLSDAGLSYDAYKQALKTQIEVSQVIANHVDLKNITVSDAEVEAYYQQNIDQFQDFQNNPDALAMLKLKIKSILLRNKQSVLVQQYVDSIKQ